MTVPAPPTAPAPPPTERLARPQIPPATPVAAPAAATPAQILNLPPTLAGSLPLVPPGTIQGPPIAAQAELTLEEQAAAQHAAGETAQLPTPGVDVMLPGGLGDGWDGKSVADLWTSHQAAQAKITELSTPATPAVAPVAPTPVAPQVQVPPAPPQVPAAVQPQPQAPAAAPAQPPPQVPAAPEGTDPYAQFNQTHAAYAEAYLQQGRTLHPNQVDAFSKATGIPPPMVLRTLENEVMRIESEEQQVYTDVGGKEQYLAMITWMERNVAREHQEQFAASLDSNEVGRIRTSVQTMYAAFQQAGGGQPQIIQGPPIGAPYGATPYANWQEVTAAMSYTDPKTGQRPYDTVPTFRAEVEQRLAVSPL